jgi:hypothetical protein
VTVCPPLLYSNLGPMSQVTWTYVHLDLRTDGHECLFSSSDIHFFTIFLRVYFHYPLSPLPLILIVAICIAETGVAFAIFFTYYQSIKLF